MPVDHGFCNASVDGFSKRWNGSYLIRDPNDLHDDHVTLQSMPNMSSTHFPIKISFESKHVW